MWYKKANNLGYMGIGQSPEKGSPVFLWWWDGSFHVEKTEDSDVTHSRIIPNVDDVICKGRFDPKTNKVSLMAMTPAGWNKQILSSIKNQWPSAQIIPFKYTG